MAARRATKVVVVNCMVEVGLKMMMLVKVRLGESGEKELQLSFYTVDLKVPKCHEMLNLRS